MLENCKKLLVDAEIEAHLSVVKSNRILMEKHKDIISLIRRAIGHVDSLIKIQQMLASKDNIFVFDAQEQSMRQAKMSDIIKFVNWDKFLVDREDNGGIIPPITHSEEETH